MKSSLTQTPTLSSGSSKFLSLVWRSSLTFSLTWEIVLIGMIFSLSLITRLWSLGARVMSHDESLHVYYSWMLASSKGFSHNPMMHGPFLFEATAFMNLLFGANDFTSRLVPAILGIFIVVAVPQLLKPWLGRVGALATSSLLLISPFVLYYSRYIRHDIQVITWTLLLTIAIFRYLQERRLKDLGLLATALALMFATMEITFIYLAIFASFLVLRLGVTWGLHWGRIRRSAEFDVLVLLVTLGAFFSSPIALLILNPIWSKLTGTPFVDPQVLSSWGLEWSTGPAGPRLWGLLALFAGGAMTIGWWWGGTRWLALAGAFGGLVATLFTTSFTNLSGLGSGLIGSLGYWLAQQEVARGDQPWYYYLIVFPLYEYLPLVGGISALSFYWIRRKTLPPASQVFVPFLLWWTGLLFVALSLAGEKMPWLSTHLAIPFILLTGWWLGQLIGEFQRSKQSLNQRRKVIRWGAVLGGVVILTLFTIRTSFIVNYITYDYTTELIGYAHGAPGVKWVMDDIETIAERTGLGRDLKIAFDDEVSWPMVWYLRDFPQQTLFKVDSGLAGLAAPVVIAGSTNWTQVENKLGNRYDRFEVIWRWWPLEDYKGLTWERLRFALLNPAMRSAIWDILWSRDYTRYAELTNQQLKPPLEWPLSSRMRVYIQKDITAQVAPLNLSPVLLPEPVDPYAGLQRQATLRQLFSTGFSSPRGLAVGPASIYVADTGNSRLVKLDGEGLVLKSWGSRTPAGQTPPAPGTFLEPWGLAIDPQGNIFVADTWNHRIQKFDANGKFLLAWGSPGQAEAGPDKFWGPRSLVISPAGRVYVADTGNKRIVVFDLEGQFLFEFSTGGAASLNEPVGLALGPEGQVYVADTWNQRIAIFSANGQFLQGWPVHGWSGESLDNKPYLAVDPQGQVYVTDPEKHRLLVFTATGKPIAVFEQLASQMDSFLLPTGIALGPDGTIWLADAGDHRVVQLTISMPQ